MSNLVHQPKQYCTNCNRYHSTNEEEKPVRISNRFDAYLKKSNIPKTIMSSQQYDRIQMQVHEKESTGCCTKSQNVNSQSKIIVDSNRNSQKNDTIKNDTKQISVEVQTKKEGCWPNKQKSNLQLQQNQNSNNKLKFNGIKQSKIQKSEVYSPVHSIQNQQYSNFINKDYRNNMCGQKTNQFQIDNELEKQSMLKKYDVTENIRSVKSMKSIKSTEFMDSHNKWSKELQGQNKQVIKSKQKNTSNTMLRSNPTTNQKSKYKRSSNKFQLIKNTVKQPSIQIKYNNLQSEKSERQFLPISIHEIDIPQQHNKYKFNQSPSINNNQQKNQIYQIQKIHKEKKNGRKLERTYIDKNLNKYYEMKFAKDPNITSNLNSSENYFSQKNGSN